MAIRISTIKLFLYALLACGVFFFASSARAAVIKPADTIGLAGYWNLDEGKGNTAYNHGFAASTGNGTLNSSPTWAAGKLGQALTFGASNNYVSTSVAWPSSGSISEWVYPTAYFDWISPSGWKTDPNISGDGFILIDEGGSGSPGRWRAVFRPNTAGAAEADVVALQNIVQNTWQHVAMTWSLSGTTYTIHLYVNGVDQGSATWSGTLSNGVGGFHFGNSGDYADNYFFGKVDEVHVYNRALSGAEVAAFYNRTAGTRYNSSAQNSGNGSNLSQGLVARWSFDGSTIGSTIQDVSGNNNSAYVSGAATSSMKVQGMLGQALSFNNAQGVQVAALPGTLSVGGAKVLSISAWVKRGTTSATGGIVNFNSQYAFDIGMTPCSTNQIKVTKYNVVDLCVGTMPSDTKYHLVTGVWNASGVTVYIDGVVSGTTSDSNAFSSSIAGPFVIGNDTSDVGGFFRGIIDDVRVYNRELSASEVAQLYQEGGGKINASGATLSNGSTLGSDLAGYWSFNGADFTDKVYDRSGNSNNGYLSSGATSTAKALGKLGQALSLDGSDKEVLIPNSPGLNLRTGSFTVAAWVKESAFNAGMVIAAKSVGGAANSTYGWHLAAFSGNMLQLHFSSSASFTTISNSTALSTGKWYHIVAVVDRSNINNSAIYINGSSAGSSVSDGGNGSSSTNVQPVAIGNESDGGFPWSGLIDEVRIYDHALSASEVSQLYSLGK